MANQEVKLLGAWMSPYSIQVAWALKLKGIEYEYLEQDLFNKGPLLLQCNPIHKKVPVLLHGDKIIIETAIILEYIDETWKEKPIMPKDPYERARARFLEQMAIDKCLNAVWYASCNEKEREKAPESAAAALEVLEAEIDGKKFFGGEKIGFLDLRISWACHWLDVLEEVAAMKVMDPQKYPSLNGWIQNMRQDPLIKDTLPARDKLVPFFNELKVIRRF